MSFDARTPMRPQYLCLDAPTRALVRVAAQVAGGSEAALRAEFVSACEAEVPRVWMEELVLQSHLFSGFPRALNAAREWRRISPSVEADEPPEDRALWRARGEATCAAVYGQMYGRLRANVAGLHPALDDWMVVDGYGKVLSRPGLDLPRRELCIVGACAITRQDRQLHSHLHGALNVGVASSVVSDALEAVADLLSEDALATARSLLTHVVGK